ncbi:NAD(P)H-quinone oxidoreductase [Paralcaligenes ginsengisoli]
MGNIESMSQDVIAIARAGGPEVLTMARRDRPQPASGQVLIRVHSAGINRHDCGQRSRGPNTHESDIPGLEVSGHIESVGGDVRGIEVGSPVCALVDGGGYAQYAIADAANVFPVPAHLSLREAASVPEAAFTSWYNFFSVGAMQPGETALIHGGTSGVGVFAIQLLRALGHAVYTTCGSDEKVAFARSLGANDAFNYRTDDFAKRMAEAGIGVDVVLDMSGGRYIDQNLAVLAYGGRIVHLSQGPGGPLPVPLRAVMQKEARITGSLMRPLAPARKRKVAEALKEHVWPLLGEAIRPVISEVYPLAEAHSAHRRLEQGDNIGKLLLAVESIAQ